MQREAFTCQCYKAAMEALAHNGSWEAAWPILCLPDPDEKMASLVSPAEQVAVAALLKEKKTLKELTRARPAGGDTPTGKGGGRGGSGKGSAAEAAQD